MVVIKLQKRWRAKVLPVHQLVMPQKSCSRSFSVADFGAKDALDSKEDPEQAAAASSRAAEDSASWFQGLVDRCGHS